MTRAEPAGSPDIVERRGDAGAEEPGHHCPLCGLHFAEGAVHCGGCPMNAGCKTVCCPRCGYEYVDHSSTIDWMGRAARALKRVFDRRRHRS